MDRVSDDYGLLDINYFSASMSYNANFDSSACTLGYTINGRAGQTKNLHRTALGMTDSHDYQMGDLTRNYEIELKSVSRISVDDSSNPSMALFDGNSSNVWWGGALSSQHRIGTDPSLYVISMRQSGSSGADMIFFKDEDAAVRVAKALNYAVKLCGGGNDPF